MWHLIFDKSKLTNDTKLNLAKQRILINFLVHTKSKSVDSNL